MAQQTIDIGAVPNDGTGDPLRDAFDKANDNFTELYRNYVLAKSGVGVSHTGNTTETTLATITVPAGAMGPNGQIEVEALFSINNSANSKTMRVRLGGSLAGATATTSTASFQGKSRIANRNSASSQVAPASLVVSSSATAVNTLAINTANAADITITGQLANAGDSVTLESYLVRVTYGA